MWHLEENIVVSRKRKDNKGDLVCKRKLRLKNSR